MPSVENGPEGQTPRVLQQPEQRDGVSETDEALAHGIWHRSLNELRERVSLRNPTIWDLPFYSMVLAIFLKKISTCVRLHVHACT